MASQVIRLDNSKIVRACLVSERGRHYLVIEAGEMKKATTLGFGDGSSPVGSKVLVKNADINVEEPSEAHHCIDIDHPWNGFMIYKVVEDLKTDPFGHASMAEFLGSSMSMGTNLEETYWKQKLYEAYQEMPPVENYQEMPPGAIGILAKADNTSKRSQIANALKAAGCELSEKAHDWMKEVVGMGMMGISASAGYGSPSVIAKATCAFAFACSATAFFLPRKWITTIRFLTKVGAIGCIGGVLAAIGQDLPLECKWWVTAFAFVAPAAAVVFS